MFKNKVLRFFCFLLLFSILIIGCDYLILTEYYDLTVYVEGEGIIESNVEFNEKIENGTQVELTANANEGWIFSHWSGDVNEVNINDLTIQFIMDGEKEITAVFIEETEPWGEQISHNVNNVDFYMRLAPAGTFPGGHISDGGSVDTPFWIGETPVTYELWYTVKQWALDNEYTFDNAGREGSHGNTGGTPTSSQPVTTVSWRDSIVWCNALSEMLGYNPVYTYQGSIIRDSTNATVCDNAVQENNNGFRLPKSNEWELAARYQGDDSSHGAWFSSGVYWTPDTYASGATASYVDSEATQAVAWYSINSGSTQNVGLKQPNYLMLYDMSGNVWEWCYEWSPSWVGTYRIYRGGSGMSASNFLTVGNINGSSPATGWDGSGLRLVRTFFL